MFVHYLQDVILYLLLMLYFDEIYSNDIQQFLEIIRNYYYNSKRKYLDKLLTYNSFITIIRQICKSNDIKYENKIKYYNSTYDIHYYILLDSIKKN